MKKCKDCNADCLFCVDAWNALDKIDKADSFLFWPSVVVAAVGLIAWWLS